MKKSLLLLMGPLVFACGSLGAQTVYFSEDFQAGSLPAGWTATPSSGAWTVPGVSSQGFAPPAHTVYASINDDALQTSANANSQLTTPVVNLSAATTVYLKYDCFYIHGTYQSITESADLSYSTDGGATWTVYGQLPSSTTAWTTNAVNLTTQLAGQANVKIKWNYNDNGGWLYGVGLDNVSLLNPAMDDATISALSPSIGSVPSYGVVGNVFQFSGTIQNNGLNPITTVAIKYNDGTTTYTDNLSVNIPSFGTSNFIHSANYTLPSVGAHPIRFWVEANNDANHSNDTVHTAIVAGAFVPVHNVTVEEATGTWCGWCVRGMVFLDSMRSVHPATCNLIAVHNGDPMVVTAYDAGVGSLIQGYPSTLVNRNLVSDPANIFPDYDNSINNFGFADITPVVTFNATTRVATVVASAHFSADMTGDYRLACVFTEDDVHSTAGGQWDQHNYYSFQSQNIPLSMPGYDFQALPQVVPSAQMYYNFVARTIVGGFNGLAGSLPASIPGNSTQTHTFTYTIPAAYDVTKMKVVVLLIDNNQPISYIMNSAGAAIPLGIDAPSVIGGVDVYPNPTSTNATVDINLLQSENVTMEVYDMAGALVSRENEGTLTVGQHVVDLNTANMANGMYFVKVTAGQSVQTIKVTVAH
jgi:hypothetical protein